MLIAAVVLLVSMWLVQPGAASGSCPVVQNTPSFTIVYGQVTIGSAAAPAGTTVEARSPRGDPVGCFVVSQAGSYGAMYLYGEDRPDPLQPPAVPGMRSGEPVAFFLNGAAAVTIPALNWVDDHDLHQAALQLPVFTLAFTVQPIRGANGFALGLPPGVAGQPMVTIKDGLGNTRTDDNTTVVSLAIAQGAGTAGATLACDQTGSGVTGATVTDGVAVFSGCKIDLAAAGYLLEATAPGLAPARTAPFNITWAGDTGGDCRVSAVDFSLVVTHFGKNSSHPDWRDSTKQAYRADLNGDGQVNVVDFSIMITRFGTTSLSCAPASDGVLFPAP